MEHLPDCVDMSLRVFVVMGVSGCGKTSLASAYAKASGMAFIEGDDLHSEAAKQKMAAGEALQDEDRLPWLHRICQACQAEQNTTGIVIACSALKRSYREVFRSHLGSRVSFLHIELDREILHQRMASRKEHFMPVSLLDSQLRSLEVPNSDETHLVVPGNLSLLQQVELVRGWAEGMLVE